MKINKSLLAAALTLTSIVSYEAMAIRSPICDRYYQDDIKNARCPQEFKATFDEKWFDQRGHWVNGFRYVIVIDKTSNTKNSPSSNQFAQSILIYRDGQLIHKDRVSTGRNEFEKKGQNHSQKDNFTVTPSGYYTPFMLNPLHKSKSYGGFWTPLTGGTEMPWAMFFTDGIAMHQAPKGTSWALGQNKSGGCVRLSDQLAPWLFSQLSETRGSSIPDFTPEGRVAMNADGTYKTRKVNIRYGEKAPTYSALVIVLSPAIYNW